METGSGTHSFKQSRQETSDGRYVRCGDRGSLKVSLPYTWSGGVRGQRSGDSGFVREESSQDQKS